MSYRSGGSWKESVQIVRTMPPLDAKRHAAKASTLIGRICKVRTTSPDEWAELQEAMGFVPITDEAPTLRDLSAHLRAEEQRAITEALIATRGNVSRAAIVLGMPRTTLHDRVSRYELARPACEGRA